MAKTATINVTIRQMPKVWDVLRACFRYRNALEEHGGLDAACQEERDALVAACDAFMSNDEGDSP